ncbi:MAG: YceI family protein [Bacteroidetes bacterium]|nr:YceI family protein [Bacteroidota bacterium]
MKTTKWGTDAAHSELQFKVKHMMITNVTGSFKVIKAEAEAEDDSFKHAKVSFTADASSVDTSNEQRDTHLKSADFFDVEKYPSLSFVSTEYDASSGKINGNLTIKGITKAVSLDVEFAGTNKDPWGNEKAGFTISGKINRKEWDLGWNAALETGGVLVSEEVRINAEIQLVKQAA